MVAAKTCFSPLDPRVTPWKSKRPAGPESPRSSRRPRVPALEPRRWPKQGLRGRRREVSGAPAALSAPALSAAALPLSGTLRPGPAPLARARTHQCRVARQAPARCAAQTGVGAGRARAAPMPARRRDRVRAGRAGRGAGPAADGSAPRASRAGLPRLRPRGRRAPAARGPPPARGPASAAPAARAWLGAAGPRRAALRRWLPALACPGLAAPALAGSRGAPGRNEPRAFVAGRPPPARKNRPPQGRQPSVGALGHIGCARNPSASLQSWRQTLCAPHPTCTFESFQSLGDA